MKLFILARLGRKTQTHRGSFSFGDLTWVWFIHSLIYLSPEGTLSSIFPRKIHLRCVVLSITLGGTESCERSSDLPIGGESLAEQYLMEPSVNPDGVLPKGGHRVSPPCSYTGLDILGGQ